MFTPSPMHFDSYKSFGWSHKEISATCCWVRCLTTTFSNFKSIFTIVPHARTPAHTRARAGAVCVRPRWSVGVLTLPGCSISLEALLPPQDMARLTIRDRSPKQCAAFTTHIKHWNKSGELIRFFILLAWANCSWRFNYLSIIRGSVHTFAFASSNSPNIDINKKKLNIKYIIVYQTCIYYYFQ